MNHAIASSPVWSAVVILSSSGEACHRIESAPCTSRIGIPAVFPESGPPHGPVPFLYLHLLLSNPKLHVFRQGRTKFHGLMRPTTRFGDDAKHAHEVVTCGSYTRALPVPWDIS